jgi:hypothetical protein
MLNMTGTGRRTGLLLGVWTAAVVVIGGVLMSYHQPFVTPDARILSLGSTSQRGRWRALHIVSGSCVCSRRVMEHLLQRRPQAGLVEEILMIEGSEIPLAGTASLLNKLEAAGYTVSRLAAEAIPESSGLHGVPVLIYATPENKLAYLGGYGRAIRTLRSTGRCAGATPRSRCRCWGARLAIGYGAGRTRWAGSIAGKK